MKQLFSSKYCKNVTVFFKFNRNVTLFIPRYITEILYARFNSICYRFKDRHISMGKRWEKAAHLSNYQISNDSMKKWWIRTADFGRKIIPWNLSKTASPEIIIKYGELVHRWYRYYLTCRIIRNYQSSIFKSSFFVVKK